MRRHGKHIMQATIYPGAMPFWMWNDASDLTEKLDFLHRCHAGGIQALTLHCRSGNLIPYASEEWFLMVQAVVEEGARLGMQIWLYDEDPYPSGAAGGMVMAERPELFARALKCCELPAGVKTGDLWKIDESRVVWAGLVPEDPSLPARDLTATVGTVRADWFMGDWDSRYYYEETRLYPCPRGDARCQNYTMRVPVIPAGFRLLAIVEERCGGDGSWNGLPDLLNPETFHSFCRLSLDKYAGYVGHHFGGTIPGIFTDEPKFHGTFPTTPGMYDDFERQYGGDLRNRLYCLFGEARCEADESLRVNYRRWLATRFLDAFVRPYRRWADANNLYLLGHLSPEDDPIIEAQLLGSLMQIMKEIGVPGTDVIVPATGCAAAPTLNLGSLRAASVRAQQQAPMAISESLALMDWDVTSRHARQLLTWQSILGIDRFFFHGFFASNEGVTIHEAPPDYGPNSSIFRGIREVNNWLKRIESLTDGCTERIEVAVLNCMSSYYTVGTVGSPRHIAMRRSLWQTLLAALQAQVAIHLVDEADLPEAQIRDGALRVGACAYRHVIVTDIDCLTDDAARKLAEAAAGGVELTWFGDGPGRLVDARGAFSPAPELPGALRSEPWPDAAWFAGNLTRQVLLSGERREACYVRRFTARDGGDYLLAVNNDTREIDLHLALEGDRRPWLPVELDGTATLESDGIRWSLPERASALFRLGKAGETLPAEPRVVRPAAAPALSRHGRNILRLQEATVERPDRPPKRIPYPRTYSYLFDDWQGMKVIDSYCGPVPVQSRVLQPQVSYIFSFASQDLRTEPELLLDPRFGRGNFDVLLDGNLVAADLHFPLTTTSGMRLPLGLLRNGEHALTLRFSMQSAMEGVLGQLYIEGDFDVDIHGAIPILRPSAPRFVPGGWQLDGMPHFMGDATYAWTETIAPEEVDGEWFLELDELMDAGELTLNGESRGTRAWPPFRWALPGLRAGENQFALRISSTAGNRFKLFYPAQPQGLITPPRLLKR